MDFIEYFKNVDLVKIPMQGVHFEQKTTPDLLWCVAHVVLDLISENPLRIFSDKEVRSSPIFDSLMIDYFAKAPQHSAENEYNKLSSYQLGVLEFAGILKLVDQRPKKYQVSHIEALEYIAVNDWNASRFITEYTVKFIYDNNLNGIFETYKNNPNQINYLQVKEAYWEWAKLHTNIRGTDRRHTYRVFNKIFNIYCYKNRLPGEDATNLTLGPCPYSFLLYKRVNFRDVDKPQGMTREEYQKSLLSEVENLGVVETLLAKAKDSVRAYHENNSEIIDPAYGYLPDQGIHVHHILPRHSYPQFSLMKENLISLTPGQHLSSAHIRGNTDSINPQFQIICLKSKFNKIKLSLEKEDGFYELSRFIAILNCLFNWNLDYDASIVLVQSRLDSI